MQLYKLNVLVKNSLQKYKIMWVVNQQFGMSIFFLFNKLKYENISFK